ncbi:MAG: peptidoglycan DD-metalloendopeptidase family protein [Anaerolineales bacterium]|nr:peptidoglycan DD-metalloendopeptidase family protein [Anaerolineales bacterium]
MFSSHHDRLIAKHCDTRDGPPSTLRLDQGGSGANLQNLSYTYDDAGNITTISDGVNASQTQTFDYDWLNRLTSASTDAAGTGQYSHTYDYDSIGNITDFDGSAYTYDAAQPHAVTAAHGNQYCYDGNANQVSRLIDGTLYSLTYDIENRLTGVSQVTSLTATIAKSGDDVQLSWSPIVSATSYEVWRSTKPYFTPGDNDSEMIAEISTTTHTDPNHIGDVDTNYFYQVIATNGGCPIAVSQQMGEFDFGITAGTTLLRVPFVATEIAFPEIVDAVPMSLNQTEIAEFVYDADGNRVKGTVNGVTTIYIAGIFEYQNGAITKYYPGAGGSSAIRRENYASDNGIFYILGDHLGSTSTIIQQNATVMKQEYYYPFGGNRGSEFSEITTKRFTGQYHEAGLPGGEGLSYYGARWYDAQLGRFLSADVIVPRPNSPQSLNRLSYVKNNPLRYIDPTGYRECEGTGSCNPSPRPSTPRQNTPRPTRHTDNSGRSVRSETLTLQRSSAQRRAQRRFSQQQAEQRWLESLLRPADHTFGAFGGPRTVNCTDNCSAAIHPGVDTNLTNGLNAGDNIYTSASGTVAAIGFMESTWDEANQRWRSALGQYIVIEHLVGNEKIYTIYAHLERGNVTVQEGQEVTRGEVVGGMGSTAAQGTVHLHFEIRRATAIDLNRALPFVLPGNPGGNNYFPRNEAILQQHFLDLSRLDW